MASRTKAAVLEFLRVHPAVRSYHVIAGLPAHSPGNIRQWLSLLCKRGVVARHFGRYALATVSRERSDRLVRSRGEPVEFVIAVRGKGLTMSVTVRDKESLDDVLRGLGGFPSYRLSKDEEKRLDLVQARLLSVVCLADCCGQRLGSVTGWLFVVGVGCETFL
jgi:hypothetical protein